MAKKVPFLGEERIARADDDALTEAKRSNGRVIDEVLTAAVNPSSWDDVVVKAASGGASDPATDANGGRIKPSAQSSVPFAQAAPFKKSAIDQSMRSLIDWKPINNGHGLRVNISGNMDMGIRSEWCRLMEETKNNGIGQYEFNFTQAPTISLMGLGMLLLFKEQKGSARVDIKLCNCNKELSQLLLWSGMDKYFVIQGASNFQK